MSRILELLNLRPSPQSVDYVENKQQFHLFNLLTEQRHPATWNLSFTIESDTEAGLRMLLEVDRDVARRMSELATSPGVIQQGVSAVADAIRGGRRIYVYGCGATGRLAKQMESTFWRPVWTRLQTHKLWSKLRRHLASNIGDLLTGEMTGADRALVSSLEGFEDLQLIGKLQLQQHAITRGDVVICVTEGGETSSVIGTVLAALEQYGPLDADRVRDAARHLYFVYNNPDDVLRPLHRSASVLDNAAITKINLATGPQAITGSTRLQATTSETFVVGAILEEAIGRVLSDHLDQSELRRLGFAAPGVAARLGQFDRVKAAVDAAVPAMARLTSLEADTYRRGRFATYFAKTALITVFIDSTERSPTFRLFPLDRVDEAERRCWVQVWTEAASSGEAWRTFLGRPFKGLTPALYREPFETLVPDPYLREAALRSLENAGDEQERLYDFSFSDWNIQNRGPSQGDLGVLVLIDQELAEAGDPESAFGRFANLFRSHGASLGVVAVTASPQVSSANALISRLGPNDVFVHVPIESGSDPLTLDRQIALKMLLNAHSTGIMAALGRVVGNTMTNVSPSNLKLIGRATSLILSHANEVLQQQGGPAERVTFAEANAVLMDAIEYVRREAMGQMAEVALSIIRILEALRRSGPVSWREARDILEREGLAAFLLRQNPTLARA